MGFISDAIQERKYKKAVENSHGLEKVRLLVRRRVATFGYLYTKNSSKGVLAMGSIMSIYMNLVDIFYGRLSSQSKIFGAGDTFDEFGEEIYSDNIKATKLSAHIFGITIGIVECHDNKGKSAKTIISNIKKDLDSAGLDYSKEILESATDCVNFLKDPMNIEYPEGMAASNDLNKMTSAFLGRKLKKGDFEDPICNAATIEAISHAY